MAVPNGYSDSTEGSVSPAQHLGKRKRNISSEPESKLNGVHDQTDTKLKNAIERLQSHEHSLQVLKYPLDDRGNSERSVKKLRMDEPAQNDSIEARISSGVYQSIEQVLEDIREVRSKISENATMANGTLENYVISRKHIDIIYEEISRLESQANENQISINASGSSVSKGSVEPEVVSNQVLSLRSQTEQGIRQLFSGLPLGTDSTNIDGRRLPNGFELTEVVTVDKNDVYGKSPRKFGDVFAPHRNTKTLEIPRVSKTQRENTLSFVPPFEYVPNSTSNNFKFANLSTGLWLKYSTVDRPKSSQKENDNAGGIKGSSLFKAAFTSFAPSTDNSTSIVSNHERSQKWWRKFGMAHGRSNTHMRRSQNEDSDEQSQSFKISDEDLQEMVANFIPEEDPTPESEKVLIEIAEMIETLSSYQSLRYLEVAKGPTSSSKPSKDEINLFDILRDQLQLLVSSLPPFAIAKLDGDKLKRLNFSTQILVQAPEFVGTAQPDDYTLRRHRAAQTATSAAVRSATPVQTRAAYNTPAAAYNAQARAYNNAPGSAYAARPSNTPMYNTPRPVTGISNAAYTQPQYRNPGPNIHTPSIQQFQRPVVNGYGHPTTPVSQPPYMNRPSQPGYQQRAQETLSYNRINQAQRVIVNGDTPRYPQHQNNIASSNNGTIQDVGNAATDDASSRRTSSATPQVRDQPTNAVGVAS